MAEEERWARVRQIVREELEAVEKRLMQAITKKKPSLSFENGKWIGVTEEQMQAWAEAYTGMDIQAELKKMAAWCVSNPHLAPKSQWGRFVNTWLVRNHNQASLRSIPLRAEPSAIPLKKCSYCDAPWAGSMNGRNYCIDREHANMAMDNVTPLGAVKLRA